MTIPFVAAMMLFMHVFDDYFLQSAFLSKGKQRSWWREVAPDERYKKDYVICLIMHAMSWSFCIMFPIAWYYNFSVNILFLIVFFINAAIHACVDDLKANCFKINLIEDQMIHIIQIGITLAISGFLGITGGVL